MLERAAKIPGVTKKTQARGDKADQPCGSVSG
jgi:hypothetical protein